MSDLFGNHIVGFPTRWLKFIFQSMMVLREAVSVAEDVMQNIQTLYTLQEVNVYFLASLLVLPNGLRKSNSELLRSQDIFM